MKCGSGTVKFCYICLMNLRHINGLLLFFFVLVYCNYGRSQTNSLEAYIEEGLSNNLVVQQRNISLQNAIIALREAKSRYLPSLDFQFLYTTSQGGRQTDLPVGDMLNPVYTALNTFIGNNVFPQIENQTINFLPHNYYDTRVRLSVPIVHLDIVHNKRIHDKQVLLSENDLATYKRELIQEIKIAYYNYLLATKAIEIYQNDLELAREGKRTNERLLEAGSGLHAYVLRAQTEVAQATERLQTATLQQQTVHDYFNALLNREPDATITVTDDQQIIPLIDKNSLTATNREELRSLQHAIAIREDIVKMNKQRLLPKLSGFADVGAQAEKMRIDKQAAYFMVGLQLSVPIYSGNRNNLHVKTAKNEVEQAKLQYEHAQRQLHLSLLSAYNQVLIAKNQYESSLTQLDLAETYFRLIDKGYQQGVNSFLETVDARTQLSKAQLATSVHYYQLLIALAKLERQQDPNN